MSLQWTVVRFVPDVIAGERINVGVVVIDRTMSRRLGVLTRFIRELSPVRDFAGHDGAMIYADWLQEIGDHLTADEVHWQAENSNGVIVFDPLQPTRATDAKAHLDRLARRYLTRQEATP